MKKAVSVAKDGKTVTVSIPLKVNSRNARKQIVVPDGAPPWSPPPARTTNALLKALARAWRWRRLAESGKYNTLAELAAEEDANFSYMCRIIRITILSPRIIENILHGRQQFDLELQDLLMPLPSAWNAQEQILSGRPEEPSL